MGNTYFCGMRPLAREWIDKTFWNSGNKALARAHSFGLKIVILWAPPFEKQPRFQKLIRIEPWNLARIRQMWIWKLKNYVTKNFLDGNSLTFSMHRFTPSDISGAYVGQRTILNKTSILWTPGSQVYLSKKKKLFGQQKQIREMHKSCIIND